MDDSAREEADGNLAGSLQRTEERVLRLAEDLRALRQPESVAEWLELRALIGRRLASVNDSLSDLDRHFDVSSARGRILAFLRTHVGETVSKEDLRGVAGISEWARRVRELREDDGWVIHTTTTNRSMRPGEYRLVSDSRQPEIVHVWAAAKSAAKLRTRGGTLDPAARLLHFLNEIEPSGAALDQLRHVIGSGTDLEETVRALERRGCLVERLPTDDLLCPGGIRIRASPD